MTKKEQQSLIRNAITRIHFHRTLTENNAAVDSIVNTLITFYEHLGRAETIADSKTRTEAENRSYEILKNLP